MYFPLYKTLIYSLAGYLPETHGGQGVFCNKAIGFIRSINLLIHKSFETYSSYRSASLDKLYRSFSQKIKLDPCLTSILTHVARIPRLIFIALPQFGNTGFSPKK